LLKEVLKDEVFRASGGGVTLSGEVLMQAGFATRLRTLRQWGIHTAIETAGDATSAAFILLPRRATKCCLI
jgi:pyruvate formate lyase activating enzyme